MIGFSITGTTAKKRAIIVMATTLMLSCAKKPEPEEEESSNAVQVGRPISGVQPNSSGTTYGGGQSVVTTIAPDTNLPETDEPIAEVQEELLPANPQVYFAAGFLGLTFASNAAVVDGKQGWSLPYMNPKVGSNTVLTTGYRMTPQ